MTLLDFVRLTRAHLLGLVVLTLVGGGAAYGLTLRMPEVYLADASGYVAVAGQGASTGDGIAAASLGGSKADSYLPLVTSRAVAERAIRLTGIAASAPEVAGRVSATVAPNSVILQVSATGPSPEESRVLADAVIKATAEEANRIEKLSSASGTPTVQIVPIESALPGGRIAPNVRKNLLVGLVVGLAVGYAIVFLRRKLDTRIRTVADVEEATASSVLGVVPVAKELKNDAGRGRLDRLGVAAEAFRQVRTNMRFVGVDDPPRSIVVTSANAHEGKSTVSATLARVLADAGQKVVIVDADLRRPMLATIFGAEGSVGLSQLLTGQVRLSDVLQTTDQPNLRLVTAGRIPPNPSELLGSARMRELVAYLSRDHVVIIDAPPLLPVTDAGVLAPTCDGALLVFAVGKAHKEQARLAARMMNQIGARVLGVVLNLAPRRGVAGVVYGYGYGHQGYAAEYRTRERYAAAPDDAAERHVPSQEAGHPAELLGEDHLDAQPTAQAPARRVSTPRAPRAPR